jgi:4-amino-4-deoxy-L-arabinose transferase-like glycosyltransferase
VTTATLGRRAAGRLVTLTFVVGVALVIHTQTQPEISDPIGYLYAGEQLARGEGLSYQDSNNEIAGPYFTLYAFQVSRPDNAAHYLGFPPGLPLLLAGGVVAGGDSRAMYYVVPLLAVLALAATYYLGVELTDDAAVGLWAALLLAASAAFWRFGTDAWSEIPATLVAALGVALFLHSRKKDDVGLSILAALVLSFGNFIRYTNVVFIAALVIYELYAARRTLLTDRQRRPFWIVCAVGVAAIPLFNHFYYGGALVTSYSPTHGWYPLPPFSLAYALGPSFVNGYSLRESLKTLWLNFPILILLAPAGWHLLPAKARVLTLAAVGFGLLAYIFYAFAPTDINSRFLLPIFPFLCVTIGQLIAVLLRRTRRPAVRRVIGIALVAGLVWLVAGHWDELRARNENSRNIVALGRQLAEATEPNAALLSYAYNDLIAVYGRRSALNYRRIPPSDPVLGRYRTEKLEACLVGSIDRLLVQSVPVYYIVDAQPPYWDSLAILQRHFALIESGDNPPVYRIGERISDALLDETGCRLPQAHAGDEHE